MNDKYRPRKNDKIITKPTDRNVFYIVERKDTVLRINSEDNTIFCEVNKIYTPENLIDIYISAKIRGEMESAEYYVKEYYINSNLKRNFKWCAKISA
ncbi:MAG: hypothetical protein K2X69_08945 [Silvanigrellaceae bacterium]|nr:hypothetical protein [Silvanigrellaceae bacterium]